MMIPSHLQLHPAGCALPDLWSKSRPYRIWSRLRARLLARLAAPLSLLLAALLVNGCASQPYPELPDGPGSASGVATDGVAGIAAVVGDGGDISNAPVSDVAKAEAAMAPVSQKVDPLPPDPATLPQPDKRQLDIRLASQRFNYFENDQLVWSGLISSGAPEHPTPRGSFKLLSKTKNKRSGSYTNFFDQPTPMPYALQFIGPYFVHEGYLPGKPASHGCVRLRYEDARFVYERMRVGDRIVVAD